MAAHTPFKPRRGGNQKVTAQTTSAAVTIGAGERSLRVINAGSVVGYFVVYKASDETIDATTSHTPVAAAGSGGSVLIIEKPIDHDTVAYISDSSTAVMHFQPGEGGR